MHVMIIFSFSPIERSDRLATYLQNFFKSLHFSKDFYFVYRVSLYLHYTFLGKTNVESKNIKYTKIYVCYIYTIYQSTKYYTIALSMSLSSLGVGGIWHVKKKHPDYLNVNNFKIKNQLYSLTEFLSQIETSL